MTEPAPPAGDRTSMFRTAAIFARDVKGVVSVGIYAVGVVVAYIHRFISYALYVAVAIIWFVPDRRTLTADEGD